MANDPNYKSWNNKNYYAPFLLKNPYITPKVVLCLINARANKNYFCIYGCKSSNLIGAIPPLPSKILLILLTCL
jgi:hypothetical protein